MRVIAGTARGRKLKSPGEATRPVTDRVKENVFNILGTDVIDANVLDLFAGAGSIGIEALSRGAKQATFVEVNQEALAALRENLRLTGLAGRAKVERQDVFRFLRHALAERYDLIYVAPPQYKELWIDAMELLDRQDLLTPEGVIVVQIHPREFQELDLQSLGVSDRRKYGSTLLLFYERKESL